MMMMMMMMMMMIMMMMTMMMMIMMMMNCHSQLYNISCTVQNQDEYFSTPPSPLTLSVKAREFKEKVLSFQSQPQIDVKIAYHNSL